MIKLDWSEVRTGELSEEQKNKVLSSLNEKAKKYPEGFDINFPAEHEYQIIAYIKNSINVFFREVGQGAETFTLAIYQNLADKENRERRR
jgi:hypothetical protein